MTFAHLLIGLILGKQFGYTLAFVVGSVLPDVDHVFVLIKNRHFRLREIFDVMKDEAKYGERYKTFYTHSLLAWILFSAAAILFNYSAGVAFSVGYFLHLVVDLLDADEKRLFFPLKKTMKGFLPVFSKYEIIVAAVLIMVYIFI